MNVKATPLETYNQDILTDEEKLLKKINSLDAANRKPGNSSNVVTLPFVFDNFSSLIVDPSGIAYKSDLDTIQYLQNAQSFKIGSVTDIVLDSSISTFPTFTGFPGGAVPNASSSYSIDFYLNIRISGEAEGNPYFRQGTGSAGLDIKDTILQIKWTMTHNLGGIFPNFEFSIADQTQKYRLSDTIDSRPFFDPTSPDSFPDFNSNATKLTIAQYNQLKFNANLIGVTFGYDLNQVNALATANKNHFNAMFAPGQFFTPPSFPENFSYMKTKCYLNLNYFGLVANYKLT